MKGKLPSWNEKQAQEREAQLTAFAVRHGADAPCFQGKSDNEEFTAIYQAALFRSQIRPLAFEVNLKDVVIEYGQTIGNFEVIDANPHQPILDLRLWVDMDVPSFPVIKALGKSHIACLIVAKDLNPKLEINEFGESIVSHGICLAVEKR